MTETLLSPSNVLLFGRVVEDLRVVAPTRSPLPVKINSKTRLASSDQVDLSSVPASIDGVALADGDKSLLTGQDNNPLENGIYKYTAAAGANPATFVKTADDVSLGKIISVAKGDTNADTLWESTTLDSTVAFTFSKLDQAGQDARHSPFIEPRKGTPGELEGQLKPKNSTFARIYGFSYEGTYYDLPQPALFLVHGKGASATEVRKGLGRANPARAPADPSRTGVAAADFEFADDLKVWSYDKSDYTIRMDVETGMFEDILLDPFFGGDGGGGVSGARVSGARVSGARVSGARVSGARVSGARLSGGSGGASD